jgi:hypothetical protein
MPGGQDRRVHVRGHRPLGTAGPQPVPHRRVHPVDRGRRVPQCGHLGVTLAGPQRRHQLGGGHLLDVRAPPGQPVRPLEPHLAVHRDPAGRVRQQRGQPVQRVLAVGPGDDLDPGVLGERSFQPGHEQHRVASRRHDQAGGPLGGDAAAISGEVVQVAAGVDQHRVDAPVGGRRGQPLDPGRTLTAEVGHGPIMPDAGPVGMDRAGVAVDGAGHQSR